MEKPLQINFDRKIQKTKIPKSKGKNFQKYLESNTGLVLESLLDIAVNSTIDKDRLQAAELWLSKAIEDKAKQLDDKASNTTNVVVLPATQDDRGKASITLPPLKVEHE